MGGSALQCGESGVHNKAAQATRRVSKCQPATSRCRRWSKKERRVENDSPVVRLFVRARYTVSSWGSELELRHCRLQNHRASAPEELLLVLPVAEVASRTDS